VPLWCNTTYATATATNQRLDRRSSILRRQYRR
jgi:hypothetical protein